MGRRFRFFSLEAIRSIRSNAAISFAATATVLINGQQATGGFNFTIS